MERADGALRDVIARAATGTTLRDGLERVLRGRTGGLIVLGHDKAIDAMSTGGFELDIEFTSQRLRELAKMDGAVICDVHASRILRAAVQLLPDPSIPTDEQGTRHRTADRVAKQLPYAVVSVSKSMNTLAVYLAGRRYVLEDPTAILGRANQALATLERYKARLDEVTSTLSALEVEESVTGRDVVVVLQRLEMVRRIASEIDDYVVELGTEGRLVSLQLEELVLGVEDARMLVVRDYLPGRRSVANVLDGLDALTATDLIDLLALAKLVGLGAGEESLDRSLSPRGYRFLNQVPRVPAPIVDRLVEHFTTLQKLLGASTEELQIVEGVGEARARSVRDGLSRLAESSILERYV